MSEDTSFSLGRDAFYESLLESPVVCNMIAPGVWVASEPTPYVGVPIFMFSLDELAGGQTTTVFSDEYFEEEEEEDELML